MKACKLHNPLFTRIIFAFVITSAGIALGQGTVEQAGTAKVGLESKVAELDQDLRTTREELAQSREEIRQLRLILEKLEKHLPATNETSLTTTSPNEQSTDLAGRVRALEEGQSVLQSQAEQEEQKKIETASKYPLKLIEK